MAGETLFGISGQGVAPWASRGVKQSLEPIDAAKSLRRTVNAELIDVSPVQFKKYQSKVSCQDTAPPAFDALEVGDTLTVDCVAELSYLTAGGSPSRTVVPGSSRVEGDYTRYRPQLVMKIVGKSQEQDEYQATVSWEIDLEEV